MKFAHYDSFSGEILGFYADDIHEDIPQPAIALSDSEWQEAFTSRKVVKNGVLTEAPALPPSPELSIAEKLERAGITLGELKAALEVTP